MNHKREGFRMVSDPTKKVEAKLGPIGLEEELREYQQRRKSPPKVKFDLQPNEISSHKSSDYHVAFRFMQNEMAGIPQEIGRDLLPAKLAKWQQIKSIPMRAKFVTMMRKEDAELFAKYPELLTEESPPKKKKRMSRVSRRLSTRASKIFKPQNIPVVRMQPVPEREESEATPNEVARAKMNEAAEALLEHKMLEQEAIRMEQRKDDQKRFYFDNPIECPDMDELIEDNLDLIIHSNEIYNHISVETQMKKQVQEISNLA